MPATLFRTLCSSTAAIAAAALLAGCGTIDNATARIAGSITPYKVEVVQGNFISREQVEALKPGMSRQQVREVLGTPLVSSIFHADRWDYVFTIKRQGVDPQQRRLTVFFSGEGMARTEGDPMPTEAEFVATLDNRRKNGKVPALEATPEQLRAASTKSTAAPAPAEAVAAPGPAVNYPPLEAPTR
jgi:outer membrane protein assembly factor BamE